MYILPDARKRETALPKVYRVFAGAGIRSQQAYGVGEPLAGVAVWSAPDEQAAFASLLGADFLRLLLSPVVFSFFKALGIFSQFERMRKQYAPASHYYLNTIAIAPHVQGKGYASALIRPFLARADAEGVSAYTETITPANVPLYEHYGFQVMEQYRVPRTDLSLWSFYRPASAERRQA
jgi:GNAT superfamily N-acetyltransferase